MEDKNKITKKEKVLKLFESKEWADGLPGKQLKMFDAHEFHEHNLSGYVEYGQKYCDVMYAKRVLQKMGYDVYIGACLYVNRQKPTEVENNENIL